MSRAQYNSDPYAPETKEVFSELRTSSAGTLRSENDAPEPD
jgi:hypothetical protein